MNNWRQRSILPSIFAIPTPHGSADRTKTPTAYYASICPKAPTSTPSPKPISTPSPPSSTHAPERSSASKPQKKFTSPQPRAKTLKVMLHFNLDSALSRKSGLPIKKGWRHNRSALGDAKRGQGHLPFVVGEIVLVTRRVAAILPSGR
jgi:hypothetical protein